MKIRRGQQGFLLIVVLVIVMLASMVALSLLFRLRAEEAGSAASLGSEQAWYAAMSGVQQAMHVAVTQANDPAQWRNNASAFYHQMLYDDGSDKWYFTIFTAAPPGETTVHYGLSDESAKLNLNSATAEMLQKVLIIPPASLQEIAPNASNSTNALSFEEMLFDAPPRPHFSTLDDLMRVTGITPGMIYGEDANHNFHLDPNEDDGVAQFPPDDSDGQLYLGMQEFATVWTYEYDIASDGSPRLQLNTPREKVPDFVLPEKAAAYLQLAWDNKKLFNSPADLLEAKSKFKDPSGKEVEVESGVGAKELPIVMDQLTTTFEAKLIGLININTASVQVLQCLPGVTAGKAENIISTRESLRPESRGSVAWLYQEGILNAEEFKKVAPMITTRSMQFRFNVAGYALPSGRYRVFEVVIDTADKEPQIVYLRDITRFGLPFALPAGEEMQNVETKS